MAESNENQTPKPTFGVGSWLGFLGIFGLIAIEVTTGFKVRDIFYIGFLAVFLTGTIPFELVLKLFGIATEKKDKNE